MSGAPILSLYFVISLMSETKETKDLNMPIPEDFDPDFSSEEIAEAEAILDLLEHSNLDQPLSDDPRDQAREHASVKRMLANLGLDKSRVTDNLADTNIASTLTTWTEELVHSARLAHRGDEGDLTFEVEDDTIVGRILGENADMILELSVTETMRDEADLVRVSASVPVPEHPVSDDDLVVGVTFTDDRRVVRFPLHTVNSGDEEFPLYELAGGVTILGLRGHVRRAWIEMDQISDNDQS